MIKERTASILTDWSWVLISILSILTMGRESFIIIIATIIIIMRGFQSRKSEMNNQLNKQEEK